MLQDAQNAMTRTASRRAELEMAAIRLCDPPTWGVIWPLWARQRSSNDRASRIPPSARRPMSSAASCSRGMASSAASNNGVDSIRDLREEANFLPNVTKYRVYIIDECHMLSPGAVNALLKIMGAALAYLVFQGGGDGLLPHHVLKGPGPPLAVKGLVQSPRLLS